MRAGADLPSVTHAIIARRGGAAHPYGRAGPPRRAIFWSD